MPFGTSGDSLKDAFNGYNSNRTWYKWDNSYVRTWLNGTFKSAAFMKEERSAIIQTEVKNTNSEGFANESSDHWGNNTKDDIFILSYRETQEYLTGSMVLRRPRRLMQNHRPTIPDTIGSVLRIMV